MLHLSAQCVACCALEHPPPKHDVSSLREAAAVRGSVLSDSLREASELLCALERERAMCVQRVRLMCPG